MNNSILTSPFTKLCETLDVPESYLAECLNIEIQDFAQLTAGLSIPSRPILEKMVLLGYIKSVDDWVEMTNDFYDGTARLKERCFAEGTPMGSLSMELEVQYLIEDKPTQFEVTHSSNSR